MSPRLLLMSLSAVLLACGAGGLADVEASDSTSTTPGDSIHSAPPPADSAPGGPFICTTVVQYARPASGGACKLFPTPCDVPQDHVPCCAGQGLGSCLGPTQCVDDPLDACDPRTGGSGCQGICQPLP